MANRAWTTEENTFLMDNAHRISWPEIARIVDRTERACKVHYNKIRKIRITLGTWKGI